MSLIESQSTYWQDLERSEKIMKLLDSGLLADCKFVVGPDDATAETINGHKIMFVLESPVLERMLIGDFIEVEKDKEIRVKDIEPHDFKNFCYLIYNNDSSNLRNFTLEEIMELHRICAKYMAQSISENLISFLKSDLKGLRLDRLIIIFEFATSLEDKSLRTAVEKEISTHDELLLFDSLNKLPLKTFYDYLFSVSKFETPPTPLMMFDAISSYFKYNHLIKKKGEETRKKKDQEKEDSDVADTEYNEARSVHSLKKRLLKLVKFDEMTPYEFVCGPGETDVLDTQQKFDILSLLCTKKFTKKVKSNNIEFRTNATLPVSRFRTNFDQFM